MEDDLKLQDFDQWVKIFILKHEGGNLSKGSKISGQPIVEHFRLYIRINSIQNLCKMCIIAEHSDKIHNVSNL